MNDSNQYGWFRTFSTGHLVCLLAAWLIVAAVAPGEMMKPTSTDKPEDLTGLSLQELYNLDIVQLNVLGAHTHPKGQIMFGYEYMFMNMNSIRDGTKAITPADVFKQGFTVAHIKMTMEEHMFDLMYAPADRLTLMAMLPYKEMNMTHQTPSGAHFKQQASGIGDLELMSMYTLLGKCEGYGQRLILNAGLSVPTGSINVTDNKNGEAGMPQVKLEYPMQLGSGTVGLVPGLTYLGESPKWAWGAQTLEMIWLGTNDSGYRLGNQYGLTGWVAYGATDWLAPSLRLDGRVWENISGHDPAYGAHPRSAEATPDRQAGERINILFGMNLCVPRGMLKGMRVNLEGGVPIYEHLTGPQLGLAYTVNVGVSYAY